MKSIGYGDLVHTRPGLLGGCYMRMFWQPVYRAQDLPAGRAMSIRIMSENFTLYRGENGTPHAVANRCAHRGTLLSTGWVEGDTIRCFYHGWRYDGSGQCVEQPGEDKSFAGKVRIRSYPTQEYKGLIFAYLGEGEAPPFPRFLEFEGILEVLATEIWPCNYFNRLDNAGDPVHVPFVHRESRRRVSAVTSIPRVFAEESQYGMRSTRIYPGGRTQVLAFHMPNSNHIPVPIRSEVPLDDSPSGGGWMDRRVWRVPVDDEHCVSFGVNLVHLTGDMAEKYRERRKQSQRSDHGPSPIELGEAVLAGKLRIQDIKGEDVYKLILVEDYVAQVGQGTIPDYVNAWMGRNDVAVILRRKVWERELRALAEARPLKQWTCSPKLSAVQDIGIPV